MAFNLKLATDIKKIEQETFRNPFKPTTKEQKFSLKPQSRPDFEDENIAVFGSGKTPEQEAKQPLPVPTAIDKLKDFVDPGIKPTQTGKTDYLTLPTDIRDTTAKQRLEKLEPSSKGRGFVAGVESAFDVLSLEKEFIRKEVDLSPKAFTLSTSTQKAPEYLEPITKETDITYGQIGKGLGELEKQLMSYGLASGLTGATKLAGVGGKVAEKVPATLFGKTLPVSQQFVSGQITDLMIDNVAQAPGRMIKAIEEDMTIGEQAKQFALGNLADIAFNLVIGGSADGIKSLLSDKKALKTAIKNKPEIVDALKQNAPEQLQAVIKSDPNIAKQVDDILKSEPLAAIKQDFELDIPIKQQLPQVEAPRQPIDTKQLISLETPKQPKATLGEKYDRTVQELVGKYDFLGKVSDEAKVQSSNLNRTLGTIENSVIKGGNQTDMAGNPVGKSIEDIFEGVNPDYTGDLFEYIFHKHNIDRAREGKGVFGETIDSAFSQNFVKNFETKNPSAVQVQQDVTNYFKNLMNEWAVPSGLTSKETADMLGEMYKNYVPTIRVKNMPKAMSQGNQTVAQILKKAKGSEDKILRLDDMMVMQTDRIIKNARKNEMLNTLADAFENNQGNVSKRVFDIKGGEKEVLDDAFEIGKALDQEPISKGNEYVINFYRNGQPSQMVVDKVTYEAFKPQNLDHMVNKVAGNFKKYATNPFKSLITEYNPAFSIANVMRDIPTALAFSDDALKMTQKVPEAAKQILTNGSEWQRFKALGGTREGIIGAGKEFKVPSLNKKTGFQDFAKQANKVNPFKYISEMNKFTESVPRFSEYLAVLEKTGDPALAIYKSADLTTDFAKHGNSTKLLDSFVPYLNPQVQGMNKFYRALKDKPLKTAMGAGASITVPTMILDQVNKDDEAYNNLSPRERNLYFQIPYTDENGERQFIRIPKSRELGVVFSSIYDWAARSARGEKVTGEEIAQTIEENFGVGITPLWEPAAKAFRQIKDTDAYETNYWGGLIVPESQRKYSPGEQYDLNSSGIAKAIGQQFGISPYVTDYLIDSYTGVGADFIQPIGADRKTTFIDPISKRFKTDPVLKSDSSNKFYQLLDEKKKIAQDENKQKLKLDPLYDSRSEVTESEEKANALNKVARQLSEIRKEQKLLQREKGNEDKIRDLQKAINKLAEEAVRGAK